VRLHRARKRNDVKCLRIQLQGWSQTASDLVEVGLLTPEQRDNAAAIESALAHLTRLGYSALKSKEP
jgi:hypothetical protein